MAIVELGHNCRHFQKRCAGVEHQRVGIHQPGEGAASQQFLEVAFRSAPQDIERAQSPEYFFLPIQHHNAGQRRFSVENFDDFVAGSVRAYGCNLPRQHTRVHGVLQFLGGGCVGPGCGSCHGEEGMRLHLSNGVTRMSRSGSQARGQHANLHDGVAAEWSRICNLLAIRYNAAKNIIREFR